MNNRNASFFVSFCLLGGCAWSGHPVARAPLGEPSTLVQMEAQLDEPGSVEVETIDAAEWVVPRSGLINLDDPRAKEAGLEDGPEPIRIFFHALRHPTRGLFIIDTGVERALTRDPHRAAVRGFVRSVAGVDDMRVNIDLAAWLSRQDRPLAGVFLTHLHLDHVMGLPDVPRGTPLYAGPGERDVTAFVNVFVRPTIDRALHGHDPLLEWQFPAGEAVNHEGVLSVIDIFGDASVWALHVPGHSPGSTAYLARTPSGPVLFTGDACHTEFGWRHEVEPGTFSHDQPRSEVSLRALGALAARHPNMDVRLGHQELKRETAAPAKMSGVFP